MAEAKQLKKKKMKSLEQQIKDIEQKIQSCDNKYKLRSLKEKLSYLRAEQMGNIVKVEDLKEYRNLIIYLIKKNGASKYIKEVMDVLMEEKIVFRTRKSIKRLICERTEKIATEVKFKNMTEEERFEYYERRKVENLPSSLRR